MTPSTAMEQRAIAAIDVGTNTTLLLVARPRTPAAGGGTTAEPEVLVEAAEITRLGRGIGGQGNHDLALGREGIERTLAVLRRYAALAARHGATIAAIGTEALRRAPNAHAFLDPAQEILGTPIEVVSGEREAALTYRAVAAAFPEEMARGRTIVVDIGGGSTEIIAANGGAVAFRDSLPLGSVRLTERFIRHDPPAADEAEALERHVSATLDAAAAAFAAGPPALLVGVAGTVTSLAAMSLGLDNYDAGRVHGLRLGLADLDTQIARLRRATQAEREAFAGLDPRRADVVFAGALLLRAIAAKAGVPEVRVSDRGIRWGLFWERAAAP